MPPKASEVAIFCRQSTGKAKQAASIPKQRDCLKRLCQTRGWPVPTDPANFYEERLSGAAAERPGLDRLETDLLAGTRRYVAIYDFPRVARITVRGLRFLHVLIKAKAQLAVYLTNQFWDFAEPAGIATLLTTSIQFLLAESTWTTITQDVPEGLASKVRSGFWPYRAPRGTRRTKDGHLAPSRADTAKLTRWASLARALGLRKAAEWITRRGEPISKSALHRLIHSPLLEGHLVYGRTVQQWDPSRAAEEPGDALERAGPPPRRQRPRPREKQIVQVEAFDPVLPPHVTESARQALEARRPEKGRRWPHGGVPRASLSPSFLTGALCGHCHQPFRKHVSIRKNRSGAHRRYEYLGCMTARCPNRRLAREQLERSVLADLQRRFRHRIDLARLLRARLRVWQADLGSHTTLERHRARLLKDLLHLEDLNQRSRIRDADVLSLIVEKREQVMALTRRVRAIERLAYLPEEVESRLVADLTRRFRHLRRAWNRFPARQRVLMFRLIFRRIIVHRHGRYDFELWPVSGAPDRSPPLSRRLKTQQLEAPADTR